MTVAASAKPRPRASYHASPVVYRILRWFITLFMRAFYRYQFEGQENIPTRGATILAVNHLHIFDATAVMPAVPRMVVTLAAGKWRRHMIINTILRMAGVIYVRRGEVDRDALRQCLAVLREEHVLAVAPEGTRSKTGGMQRAKPGIAYLASHSNAVIVPIGIAGTERFRSAWRHLRRPVCHVVIGRPFRLPAGQGKVTTDQLQAYADLIMVRIGLLLPSQYRGVYAERIAAVEAGQSDEAASLIQL